MKPPRNSGPDSRIREHPCWCARWPKSKRAEVLPSNKTTPKHHLAPILKKEDGLIDWSAIRLADLQSPSRLHTLARDVTPFFAASLCRLRCAPVQLARSRSAGGDTSFRNRSVYSSDVDKNPALELIEVQLPGKKRMAVEAFLNGYHLTKNEKLG